MIEIINNIPKFKSPVALIVPRGSCDQEPLFLMVDLDSGEVSVETHVGTLISEREWGGRILRVRLPGNVDACGLRSWADTLDLTCYQRMTDIPISTVPILPEGGMRSFDHWIADSSREMIENAANDPEALARLAAELQEAANSECVVFCGGSTVAEEIDSMLSYL